MVVVRRCEDRNALAEFLFAICVDDLKPKLRLNQLTPEFLAAAIASWDIVEFFDQGKEIIIGAAAREPNGYMHIYIDSCRRVSWAPHTSLQAALDIFLSNYDKLYAAIPIANRATINLVRKLGFVYTSVAGGFAFHVLTAQTRRGFWKSTQKSLLSYKELRYVGKP